MIPGLQSKPVSFKHSTFVIVTGRVKLVLQIKDKGLTARALFFASYYYQFQNINTQNTDVQFYAAEHSGLSLIPVRRQGKGEPKHLETRQSMSLVAAPE